MNRQRSQRPGLEGRPATVEDTRRLQARLPAEERPVRIALVTPATPRTTNASSVLPARLERDIDEAFFMGRLGQRAGAESIAHIFFDDQRRPSIHPVPYPPDRFPTKALERMMRGLSQSYLSQWRSRPHGGV